MTNLARELQIRLSQYSDQMELEKEAASNSDSKP